MMSDDSFEAWYGADVEYGDLITELVRRREARGMTITALANRIGASKQKLRYWEIQRNRADVENLRIWAAELGLDVVIDVVPSSAPPLPFQFRAALVELSSEDQAWVLKLAQLLPDLDKRDHNIITGIIEQLGKPSAQKRGVSKPA